VVEEGATLMDSRSEILARIRMSPFELSGEVPRDYRKRGSRTRPELLEQFIERVSDYGSRVARVLPFEVGIAIQEALTARGVETLAVPEGVPAHWLRGLSGAVKVLMDPAIGPFGSPSSSVSGQIRRNQLDSVGGVLTGCALGIAETGSLVLDGGLGQGRRVLTLLPDYHLCVVSEDQVVETVPEAVDILAVGVRDWRSPITFISGPSATSDIELDRVEGVHGPRTLEVILLADDS
jgi:L-lactate dehydrogenase complex protein LldG